MQGPTGGTMQGMDTQYPATEEEKQQLKCPRCESINTKFCYYNNYNLSQPRHFCKDCRRYWTKGGTLRNIPVGGGTRKNSKRSSAAGDGGSNPKRLSTSATSDPSSAPLHLLKPEPISILYPPIDHDDTMLGMTGSFSSLLASSGNFGNLMDTLHSADSCIGGLSSSSDQIRSSAAPARELQSSNDSSGSENPTPQPENFLGLQGDSSYWAGGWPDLSIYTPGSSFH